ncbi:hypothetical protein PoB_003192200 [Plakobranchus ocellatus]|uniref:Uncharacterized protein n=1 Tax=Plakobranchus ocellatus TaxID=259542 RepID=A0AAV4AEK2_9GAST|nr:hypothetical protein PoB_003192200 [Plakobranchus ocellatus]
MEEDGELEKGKEWEKEGKMYEEQEGEEEEEEDQGKSSCRIRCTHATNVATSPRIGHTGGANWTCVEIQWVLTFFKDTVTWKRSRLQQQGHHE